MFSTNNFFRNVISVLLVVLFGFSAVINLFQKDTYIAKIGKYKIKIKDIQEMGGYNQETAMNAFRMLSSFAYLSNEADALGLRVTDSDIQEKIKTMFPDGNGQFSKSKLDEYLDKSKMTNNGLIQLVKHIILAEQLFALVNQGITVPSRFIDKVVEGVNTTRSGYVYGIRPGSITEVDVSEHIGQPTHEDLFKYLLNTYAGNTECYVFDVTNIDTVDTQLTLNEARTQYPHSANKLTGELVFHESIGTIKIADLNFNSNSFTSNVAEQNGRKYFVYYDPFVGQDISEIERKWRNSHSVRLRAARVMGRKLADQINGLNSNESKIRFVQEKFKLVEYVSLKSCFQKQNCPECTDKDTRCSRCLCNDCMCPECFNDNNMHQINRVPAVLLLLASTDMIAISAADEEGAYVVVPVGSGVTEHLRPDDVVAVYTSMLRQVVQQCARVDTMSPTMA